MVLGSAHLQARDLGLGSRELLQQLEAANFPFLNYLLNESAKPK